MQPTLSVFILLGTDFAAGYLLTNPPGKYNVTLRTGPLVDYTRNDPFAAQPAPRALMVSVFQPATCAATVEAPYMPNKTANYQGPFIQQYFNVSADLTPLFLEGRLPVCSHEPEACTRLVEDVPILLFSPGYIIPRFYYNYLASSFASHGFMVITIDHPEDANIITYLDGHAVYNNITTFNDGVPTLDEHVRAADASFIIDQLSNATAMAELLPHHGRRPLSTKRVAMMGHSLGGGTAVLAASQDPRIRGAIDWDGTIFGSLSSKGLSKPMLFISRVSNVSDPSWLNAWSRLTGPKLWLEIADTTHYAFSDVPSMFQAAGVDAPPMVAELLGTIAPSEMVRILTTYTVAWMHEVFAGDGGPLLHRANESRFPEVSVVKENDL